MSYTPHTWVNNETITAAKLNNIEDGVQEAAQSGGGGGALVLIYVPNSTVGYQATGLDFATALSMVQQGIPFAAYEMSYEERGAGFRAILGQTLIVDYTTTYPDRIDLMITGGVGYYWTANGIEYYD